MGTGKLFRKGANNAQRAIGTRTFRKSDGEPRVMQLFWHRRDLRTADNRGLASAADSSEVVPVLCFDDVLTTEPGGSPNIELLDDGQRGLGRTSSQTRTAATAAIAAIRSHAAS